MTNPAGSFIWYELMSPDPDASKAFYDAVMRWTIEPQPAGEMDYRMIVAPDGNVGGVMRLTPEMTSGGARPAWLGYIGVDDVDASVADLTGRGGSVLMPPWDIPGIGRVAMVADQDGVPVYLMRPLSAETATSTAFSPTAVGHVSWNELSAADQSVSMPFYAGLFGWTSSGSMPMGPLGDYTFLSHAGVTFGAVMNRVPDGPPPCWTFYFRVTDVAAAGERIRAGGGAVLHGPSEVPGSEHIIVATDPHGAMFGIVGSLEASA